MWDVKAGEGGKCGKCKNTPPTHKNCWQVTAKSLQSMETLLTVELSQDSKSGSTFS